MVKRYYEKLYGSKLNNLYEMNIIIDKHILPKLTWEERENISSFIFIIDIESANKNLSTKEDLGPDGFTCEILNM